MIEPVSWTAKALQIRDECRNVKTFKLSTPPGFSFLPGQWVMFHFSDAPELQRAYSISSSPLQPSFIEISLSDVGPFTDRMFKLKPDDALEAKGPYGKWVYAGQKNAVCVSGGTGITPFRSMARSALSKGPSAKMTILYSAKTRADMLYAAELEDFARRGLKVYVTLTAQTWDGPMGRLTPDLVARESPGFPEADFFFCGPNDFVHELVEGLAAKGVPRERLYREQWGDYSL